MMDKCPTCGSQVRISSSDEGTGCFMPDNSLLTPERALAMAKDAVMALPARGDMRRMAIQALTDKFKR